MNLKDKYPSLSSEEIIEFSFSMILIKHISAELALSNYELTEGEKLISHSIYAGKTHNWLHSNKGIVSLKVKAIVMVYPKLRSYGYGDTLETKTCEAIEKHLVNRMNDRPKLEGQSDYDRGYADGRDSVMKFIDEQLKLLKDGEKIMD